MKSFLGTIILMGIHRMPALADYWSSNPGIGAPSVVRAFPMNRFMQLLRTIHFNDNSTAIPRGDPGHDRAHKVRPVIQSIQEKCLSLYNPHRECSVDEAMVGFKGRSSLKQFSPDKPTKRGYKVWYRCDSHTGYNSYFEIYLGKQGDTTEKGLGRKVVLNMTKDIYNKGYHVYFDNFFSSPDLASQLIDKKTYCGATVRAGRKCFPVFNLNQIGGLERGEDISEVIEASGNNIHCFIWRDKKPIRFLNTIEDPRNADTVRRKMPDGTSVVVPCPTVVKLYNKYMDGVDMADQKRKLYSCSRKSKKKWYMRIFWFLLDTAVVNAHILECESPNHRPARSIGLKKQNVYRTQKAFITELSQQLIDMHNSRKTLGRPSTDPDASRFTKHVVDMLPNTAQCKVCSKPDARRRTKFGCVECNMHLCYYPCHKQYHTKP